MKVEAGLKPLRLGFLGSLMVSKAPHVLLHAAERLPRGSVTIDLIGAFSSYHGDDSYRERLTPYLAHDGVHATGPIANDAVSRALSAIDVLVVPSIWPENSPLVIQEAFLAGLPVVASRIGGIPEVVHDGVNGLLFTPGDPDDLARQLARLIADPGLLAALRRGIPSVRTIAEDVDASRRLYRQHLASPRKSIPRLAAVVLNFRTPDETLLTIRSLIASRRAIDDIIVVNNDELDETRTILEPVWPHISYLHTGRNLGFSGGMNVGIREALTRGAARVLLVNSDVIVPPDCIERLEQTLDANASTGIVGPMVLSRQAPDRIASAGMQFRPLTGRMRHARVGERIRESDVRARAIVDGVSGCVMLISRGVFDAIGLLHEEYFFSFEDLDFCLAARRAGFATVITGLAKVYHEGGQSIGATSARRLYFAARNHLLLTSREPSPGLLASLSRSCSVVALNVAHAVASRGGSMPTRLAAVARGTRDYFAGRFGADAGAG